MAKDGTEIRIAVVDDRGSVVDEFEELFGIELPDAKVVKFETADAVLEAISSGGDWAYWIVDLMMPIGASLGKIETEDGLSTGVILIKRLIESEVSVSGEIIAFTLRDVNPEDFGLDNGVAILPKRQNTTMDVVIRVREKVLDGGQ